MLFATFVNTVIDHTLVVDTAIDVTGSSSVSDPKSHLTYVQETCRGGIGAAVKALAKFPDKSMLHLLTRLSKGLAVNADGYYTMGSGNLLSNNTFDGQEIAASGTDALIDGSIICVEVTYDTPAAAAVDPGPSNPFGAATVWRYAEPDSAAAIRRRRLLDARHDVKLYSFEAVAKHVYAVGTGIRITYFPGNFGSSVTDQVPSELHFLCMAAALSMLYGQKGGASGINAAQYYFGWFTTYLNILASGNIEMQPLPPYSGS